jgi:hypothetical protein
VILIKVAMDLFNPGCVRANGHTDAGAGEIAGWLDPRNFRAVVNAMLIARGSLRALDVLAAEGSGHM